MLVDDPSSPVPNRAPLDVRACDEMLDRLAAPPFRHGRPIVNGEIAGRKLRLRVRRIRGHAAVFNTVDNFTGRNRPRLA
jgi:hypothetical protein